MSAHIEALARLTVRVGANIAPGQTVVLNAKLGQEPLARALTAACYQAGAHQVEVHYADPYVQRARLQHAPEESLGEVIPWVRQRPGQLAEMQGALISLSGPAAPGLLDDIEPARIGRDTVALMEWAKVIDEASVNWTIVPGPNPAWAKLVFPELEEPDAVAELWKQIGHICRLDEPDPLAAWWERSAELARAAGRLDAAQLDALHFRGLGTDLTLGLLPGVRWAGGRVRNGVGAKAHPQCPDRGGVHQP